MRVDERSSITGWAEASVSEVRLGYDAIPTSSFSTSERRGKEVRATGTKSAAVMSGGKAEGARDRSEPSVLQT
jgi:hypothetical protein